MKRRLFIWLAIAAAAAAQQAAPRVYSYELSTRFFAPDPVSMHVDRDHDRELIEFMVAPLGFNAKPARKQVFFDFKAHQVYIRDADGACRVIRNRLEDHAPRILDPLGGGWADDLAADRVRLLRRETINGMPARVVDDGDHYDWLAKDYDFPLRRVSMSNGKPLPVELDVTRLRFVAPLGAVLEFPSGCSKIDGELGEEQSTWIQPLRLEAAPLRLPPPVYSLRWTTRSASDPATIDAFRDHDREAIEVIGAHGTLRRALFDFAKHQVFIEDERGCHGMRYAAGDAPAWVDPVTAGKGNSLTSIRPKLLMTERVNGMLARVYDAHDAGPGKIRLWLAQDYDFPLKVMGYELDDDDWPIHSFKVDEVLRIRYAAPAASKLEGPKTCENSESEIDDDFAKWEAFLKPKP
ncbi:MAG TPA: hypothetical protein VGL53_08180 [Bryobacteraceae bacterium]|jgi:hypothetical protein